MTRRLPRIVVATLCCLLAVATSAFAQSDECARLKAIRQQAENQLMALLASPLRSFAEMAADAVKQGTNPNYDPYPAAYARREAEVQQGQLLIAQISKREQEVCSGSVPAERGARFPEPGQRAVPPAPTAKDRPACPMGEYWNSARGQCMKIGEE